jgi:hypothetical protein
VILTPVAENGDILKQGGGRARERKNDKQEVEMGKTSFTVLASLPERLAGRGQIDHILIIIGRGNSYELFMSL